MKLASISMVVMGVSALVACASAGKTSADGTGSASAESRGAAEDAAPAACVEPETPAVPEAGAVGCFDIPADTTCHGVPRRHSVACMTNRDEAWDGGPLAHRIPTPDAALDCEQIITPTNGVSAYYCCACAP